MNARATERRRGEPRLEAPFQGGGVRIRLRPVWRFHAAPAKRSASHARTAASSRAEERKRTQACCSCQTGTSSHTHRVGLWASSRGKSANSAIAEPFL